MPLAILEAMAAGLPVIATRVGEIPNMLADGEEGLLIDVGDVSAMAGAIKTLVGNPSLRKKMGAASRRRAEEEFSLQRMAERIAAMYAECRGGRA